MAERKQLGDCEITHAEMSMVLGRHYKTKIPANFTGATGIGKSYVVKEEAQAQAKKEGCEFVEWNEISDAQKESLVTCKDINKKFIFADIRLTQLDPSDLRGLPQLNNTEYVKWLPPLLWRVLSREGVKGIVFFDEANLAAPMIQASMYQILNDKQCGELSISKGVVVFAAGNRMEDKAHIQDEAAPLKNRRGNYQLQIPAADTWIEDYAIPIGLDARIMGFLKTRAAYIHKFDPNSKSQSFPTPRAWEKLSNLIVGIDQLKTIQILASGVVGAGVATEFVSFIKMKDKLNIDSILKDPKKAKKIEAPDEKCALVSGIAEKYRADKKILAPALDVCNELDAEFGLFMLKLMKTFRKEFVTEVNKHKVWTNTLCDKYHKYLT